MKFDEFINIIRKDSQIMAKRWAEGVSKSRFTKTYKKLSQERLVQLSSVVYENLGLWLAPETSAEEVGKIYVKLGVERYDQGFPLCEVTYALHYEKKILLNHIFFEGMMPDTLKLYKIHDFVAKVHDFFDLATFYLTRGFQEALYKAVCAQKGVDKKNIEKIFPAGSFYYEVEPEFRTFEKALEGFNLFKVK